MGVPGLSRYLVDKLLHEVDVDPARVAAYQQDPAGFVARWEKEDGPRLLGTERTSSHAFTDEERQALATLDYGTLYALGAHPVLLWRAMSLLLERTEPDRRQLAQRWRERVAPYGRPDYST